MEIYKLPQTLILLILLSTLAACSLAGKPIPTRDIDDDESNETAVTDSRYDLTNDEDVRDAYRALTGDKADDNDFCITHPDNFEQVAIVGWFASDRGCLFEQAIVGNSIGTIEAQTAVALQRNGWADEAMRESLALIWTNEALLADRSIVHSENDDFLRSGTPDFTPPAVTTDPDGSVTISVWTREPSGMLPENAYSHYTVRFNSDGTIDDAGFGFRFSVPLDGFEGESL